MKVNKSILFFGFLLLSIDSIYGQTSPKEVITGDWYLKDLKESGKFGISLDKAYQFLKGKKSKTVIVADIDSGIDTLHEDLKEVLWHNPKEIPGNGIDDDKNGYVDDIYGWNFLGGHDGKNVTKDSDEKGRVYYNYKSKFEDKKINVDELSKEERSEYDMWQRAKNEVFGEEVSELELLFLKRAYVNFCKNDSTLKALWGKEIYTSKELNEYSPAIESAKKAKSYVLGLMNQNDAITTTNKEFADGFKEYLDQEEAKANAKTNPPKSYRNEIVKDNYSDFNDRYYGNNNVFVDNSNALHGTHVSGIIGALRNNKKGIDGIADNVKIMMIRAVPDGDEHDKDIALAIRYAVDNGAQIINMSFGKSYSPEKKWVDEAAMYARSKGVLIVLAAGNDSKNIDTTFNFPNSVIQSTGKKEPNWITVGATSNPSSSQKKEEKNYQSLTAYFSNYGKQQVDLFAPGMNIYSTAPGSTYQSLQGTSFSAPIVAGIAALILEYFPALSAEQIKYAIENSVVKPSYKVNNPGNDKPVELSELCKTGGVVNAYEAIKLASTLKGERKNLKPLKAF